MAEPLSQTGFQGFLLEIAEMLARIKFQGFFVLFRNTSNKIYRFCSQVPQSFLLALKTDAYSARTIRSSI
jgi:hypothetical protein